MLLHRLLKYLLRQLLEDSGIQAGGHIHPQFPALCLEFVPVITAVDQRLLNQLPAQTGGDALDGAMGAGAVVAGTNVVSKGQALGLLQAGIVAAIKISLYEYEICD